MIFLLAVFTGGLAFAGVNGVPAALSLAFDNSTRVALTDIRNAQGSYLYRNGTYASDISELGLDLSDSYTIEGACETDYVVKTVNLSGEPTYWTRSGAPKSSVDELLLPDCITLEMLDEGAVQTPDPVSSLVAERGYDDGAFPALHNEAVKLSWVGNNAACYAHQQPSYEVVVTPLTPSSVQPSASYRTTEESLTVPSIYNGDRYGFSVTARCNGVDPASDPASVEYVQPIPAPSMVSAWWEWKRGGQLNVIWGSVTTSDQTAYEIEYLRGGEWKPIYRGLGSTHLFIQAPSWSHYHYNRYDQWRVRAVNILTGEASGWSAPVGWTKR